MLYLRWLKIRHWVINKLPEIRLLNQGTFFSFTELNEHFETASAIHVVYGDGMLYLWDTIHNLDDFIAENSGEEILSAGLTGEQFEKVLLIYFCKYSCWSMVLDTKRKSCTWLNTSTKSSHRQFNKRNSNGNSRSPQVCEVYGWWILKSFTS
jgi:hypothetical protein